MSLGLCFDTPRCISSTLGVAILRFHVHVSEEKKRTRCGAGAENPTARRYFGNHHSVYWESFVDGLRPDLRLYLYVRNDVCM